MTKQNEQKPASTNNSLWPAILPCMTVFAATFLLFGMFWPAMSPGVRASVSVDFCLPPHISSLSETEIRALESLLARQVSAQLTGQKFESLIWQTQRSGPVNSDAIEYFDHESISQNIGLSFNFRDDGGRLSIEYACFGHSDQLRFLQLVGQQVATSIDGFFISQSDGLVAGNQLNSERFDRAIWLTNQIQTDLNHHQNSSHHQAMGGNRSPYSFASAQKLPSEQNPSQLSMESATDSRSIDTSSLLNELSDIKTQSTSQNDNDLTFSVLSVGTIKSRAINATPRRGALLGLLAMSSFFAGLVAMYQFAPVKPSTSVESLSESLGIPVVAVLPAGEESKPTNSDFLPMFAQSLTTLSKYFLIFAAIVILLFCILDSSIRQAFFQNPFDGLAKIFGVFFGHA